MREQIADFFLRAGVAPPPAYVESLSSKVISELIASSESAVSIVPADIAQELARIAGVAIVPYKFGWTLPPITLFQRVSGANYVCGAGNVCTVFARGLRRAIQGHADSLGGRRRSVEPVNAIFADATDQHS